MRYPFHPLCGQSLRVYLRNRRGDPLATVFAEGRRIQIPTWMLEPSAERFALSAKPSLEIPALLLIADAVEPLLDTACSDSADGRNDGWAGASERRSSSAGQCGSENTGESEGGSDPADDLASQAPGRSARVKHGGGR